MKQIANRKSLQATLIVALALISTVNLMAQNGNTFPSTGNAGVGTNNPSEKFEVVGNTKVKGDFTVTDTTKLKGDIKFISLKDLNINDDRFIGINKHGKVKTYTNILLNTPNGVLDVNGNIYSSGTLTANNLNITGVTTFTNKMHAYRIAPLPGDSEIRFGDSTIILNTYYNRITFSSSPSGNLGLGIGTMTQSQAPRGIAIGNNLNVYKPFSVVIGKGYGNSANQSFNNDVENSLMVSFNTDLPTFFVGPANGQGTTGNVGIGTKMPNSKFDIRVPSSLDKALLIGLPNSADNFVVFGDGYVVCRDVKVTLNALTHPDYVFAPNYKLMTLAELQQYITQNKHLPNVPSAEDVKTANGVSIAEMQKVLLEKIEELTLYMLQQNNKTENLETEITKLKKIIEQQQVIINKLKK